MFYNYFINKNYNLKGKENTRNVSTRPATSSTSSSSSSSTSLLRKRKVDEVVPPTNTMSKNQKINLEARLIDLEETMSGLKNRVLTAESSVTGLQTQLTDKDTNLQDVERVKSGLQNTLSSYQDQIFQIELEKQEINRQIERMTLEFNQQIMKKENEYLNLTSQYEALKSQYSSLQHELVCCNAKIQSLESQLDQLKEHYANLTSKLSLSENKSKERLDHISLLKQQIEDKREAIRQLEEKAREDEMLRRKLHNSIQELKGNIRVFCRLRPVSEGEEMFVYDLPDKIQQKTLAITAPSNSISGGDKKLDFSFDRVFPPASSQGEVFEEISGLIQSALDGYNVCIFTYGQTGSGKTYTMEGPHSSDEEHRGMIPRAVHQIFSCSQALASKGWSYSFVANYLEIYNETIRDLLAKPAEAPSSKSKSKNNKDGGENEEKVLEKKFRVIHGKDNSTSVTNLTYIEVKKPTEVHDILRKASQNRAVARTECNERSSRSHSVFQLCIKGRNSITGEEAVGVMSLVDLAGSERLKESKATGARLKETQNINKSLACLGDVISALANKNDHVPYRNSLLTFLLQNSLGGNCKTLMFVNVSPNVHDLNESVNSLRFATKVNACDIGVARKGIKVDFNRL